MVFLFPRMLWNFEVPIIMSFTKMHSFLRLKWQEGQGLDSFIEMPLTPLFVIGKCSPDNSLQLTDAVLNVCSVWVTVGFT